MAIASLAIRFVVELLGVGAVGFWGFQVSSDPLTRTIVGIGAPLLLVAVWAVVVAPKATNTLGPRVRGMIGTALLLVAAGALALAGQPVPAALLALVTIVNQLLLIVLGVDASAALGRAADPRA